MDLCSAYRVVPILRGRREIAFVFAKGDQVHVCLESFDRYHPLIPLGPDLLILEMPNAALISAEPYCAWSFRLQG
jgi:hypothetical protein